MNYIPPADYLDPTFLEREKRLNVDTDLPPYAHLTREDVLHFPFPFSLVYLTFADLRPNVYSSSGVVLSMDERVYVGDT
eukprot:gene2566-biopygen2057